MPKDYAAKSRSASKTSTPRRAPQRKTKPAPQKNRFWLGFFSGFSCFALGTALFHIVQNPSAKPTAAQSEKASAPDIPKPRFDFYNILQESTVKVDEPEYQPPVHRSPPKTQPKSEPLYSSTAHSNSNQANRIEHENNRQQGAHQQNTYQKQATAKTDNTKQWSLQAGSFRAKSDADRLRARLLLQNFDVRVDTVNTPSKGTWHRVLIGPYSSQQSLAAAKSQLARLHIDVFSIRS